ncbi:MAG: PIN domain-containing protein [Acidobacteriota bacterium]
MSKKRKVIIDTNLLLRFLTNDDAEKAEKVQFLLEKAEKKEIIIIIPSIIIAELVWVLESYYKIEREEIMEMIISILNTPGIQVVEKDLIYSSIKTYENKKIDFVDSWISEFAREKRIETILTFDTNHFKKIDWLNIETL